jgi:hypothetical protein
VQGDDSGERHADLQGGLELQDEQLKGLLQES